MEAAGDLEHQAGDAGFDKICNLRSKPDPRTESCCQHPTAGSLSTKCPSVIYQSVISLRQEVAATQSGGTMSEETRSHGFLSDVLSTISLLLMCGSALYANISDCFTFTFAFALFFFP